MFPSLLLVFVLPALGVPFVYFTGKKSPRAAAILVALIALVNMILLFTTVPTILNSSTHEYIERYEWIPILQSEFTLFADGISASLAIITTVLIIVAALFSVDYMKEKKNLAVYYSLLTLLSIGLVGVFITSNLLLFYFCLFPRTSSSADGDTETRTAPRSNSSSSRMQAPFSCSWA